MPYNSNPYLPSVRRDAVRLVKQRRLSMRTVAKHFGVEPSTISRWCQKDPTGGWEKIPTQSCRPHHHPYSLRPEIVSAIVERRKEHQRCAKIIHAQLVADGIVVSLASVKRVLKREKLLSPRSKWKKWHVSPARPQAMNPGDLVQLDTIHMVPKDGKRWYVYTLIDLFSRWAYAKVSLEISATQSLTFIRQAQKKAPFQFFMLQSDHGSEFSKKFSQLAQVHTRHSRLRRPNDNAHIERFNRTVQEECFSKVPDTPQAYQKALGRYLVYYNTKRLHLGINCQTPLEVLRRS